MPWGNRLVRTFVVGLATTLVAGCGTSGSTSTSPSGITGKIVVLNWQAGSFPIGHAWAQIDANFMKLYPGVTVEDAGMPFNSWETTYRTAFATKSGADIFFMLAPGYLYGFENLLEPLNSRVTADMKAKLTGWEAVTDTNKSSQPIYGIPYNVDGEMFYYNKAVFQKAGLDPNNPPSTWSDLLAACAPLKAAGFTPFGGGAKNGVRDLFGLLWSSVNSESDARALGQARLAWTDPKVKAVAQLIIDLKNNGCLSPAWASTDRNAEAVTNWQAGKVGIIEHYMGYVPKLPNASDLGFFELASINNQPRGFVPLGTSVGFSIGSWSKNKEAAWAYVKYVSGLDAEQLRLEVDAIGPTNKDVNLANAKPDMKFVYDYASQHSNVPRGTVWTANVKTSLQFELDNQITAVFTGQKTLDAALQAMETAAQQSK